MSDYVQGVILGDIMLLILFGVLVVCAYLLGKSAGIRIGYHSGKKDHDKLNEFKADVSNNLLEAVLQEEKYILNEYNKLNNRYCKLLKGEKEDE